MTSSPRPERVKDRLLGLLRKARSSKDELGIIMTVFREVGIAEPSGRLLVRAMGIEDRSDLSFVRGLEPEFLLHAVEAVGGTMSPLQALRLCRKLTMLPNVGVKDNAGLLETLRSFGAVENTTLTLSNALLVSMRFRELCVPTYPRLVIKRLRNIDEVNKTVSFMLSVVLRFDFHDLPTQLNELILERISLRVNDVVKRVRDTEHETKSIDPKRALWRVAISLSLDNTPFTSDLDATQDYSHYADFPFDRIEIHVYLELLPFVLTTGDILAACDDDIASLDGWRLRFNLHRFVWYAIADEYADVPVEAVKQLNKNVQLKVCEHANKLPNFQILHNLSSMTIPIESEIKRHRTPGAKFMIPMLRHPGAAMRSMVLPLLALNLGTLLTLFMNDVGANYNDRLANLITLMVALFAFLGYARSEIPDVPTSTWIDRAILRSTLMAMAVMLESLFAFLTSRGASRRRVAVSYSKSSKGGAFHYLFDLRPTYRSLVRCFAFGAPLVVIQLSTIWSLYTSYRRYVRVLAHNEAVVEFFRQSEEMIGGNEKFSRRQYSHPGDATPPSKHVIQKVPQRRRKSRASRCSRYVSPGVRVTKNIACANAHVQHWRKFAGVGGEHSPNTSVGSASSNASIGAFVRNLRRENEFDRQAKDLKTALAMTRKGSHRDLSTDVTTGSDADEQPATDLGSSEGNPNEPAAVEDAGRFDDAPLPVADGTPDDSEQRDVLPDLATIRSPPKRRRRQSKYAYSLDEHPDD